MQALKRNRMIPPWENHSVFKKFHKPQIYWPAHVLLCARPSIEEEGLKPVKLISQHEILKLIYAKSIQNKQYNMIPSIGAHISYCFVCKMTDNIQSVEFHHNDNVAKKKLFTKAC
jgi:hypothetical protein